MNRKYTSALLTTPFNKFLMALGVIFFVLAGAIWAFQNSRPSYSVNSELVGKAELEKYLGEEAVADGLDSQDFQDFISAQRREQIESIGEEVYLERIELRILNANNNSNFAQILVKPGESRQLIAGNIKVLFPEGAVDQPLIITFKSSKSRIIDSETQVGKTYELTAENIYGEEVTRFNQDLTFSTQLTSQDMALSNWRDAATYYLNENTGEWQKLESKIKKDSVVAMTNHFTLYSTYVEQPLGWDEDEYAFGNCGTVIDDDITFGPFLPEDDVSMCFDSTGDWEYQDSGYAQDSLYSDSPLSVSYWTPDFESLSGTIPVSVTIPSIQLGDEELEGEEVLDPVELSTRIKYLLLTGEGIVRIEVDVNQFEEEGNIFTLGEFEFNETDAQLALWGLYLDDAWDKYLVADAACFGPCPAGAGDLTPPTIDNVKNPIVDGNFLFEATVTDSGTGVDVVYVSINGQLFPMQQDPSNPDIYSVSIPYAKGKDAEYFIIAYDNVGNESTWSPLRGYVTRGPGLNIGIPPEQDWYLHYKPTIHNTIQSAQPGISRCSPCAGDPINTLNGNLLEQVELVKLPGRPEIDFKINYNSLSGGLGVFGESWIHSYSYKLLEMSNANFRGVVIAYPSGYTAKFDGPEYTPPAGNFDTLEKTGDGYLLTLKDKTKITFDDMGDITRHEDINGNGLTFEYIDQTKLLSLSKLTKITADGGRWIEFTYNGDGLVEVLTTMMSKTITFEYGGIDNLLTITDGNGGVTKFDYDKFVLTNKMSPAGHNYYVNTYDDDRRVIKQVAGEGFTQEYLYEDGVTKIKDLNGNTGEYGYDEFGMMIYSLDESGNKTEFIYNEDKKLIAEVDPEGNRTEYEYDESGNTVLIRDANGALISREFNEFNKPISQVNKLADHVTTWEYDGKGNVTKLIDALGNVQRFEYNGFGQLVKTVDPKGSITKFEYNDFGDLVKVRDAEWNIASFEFDDLGRKVGDTNPRGNSHEYGFDLNNNLISVNGPEGTSQNFVYDPNNRVTSITDANGNTTAYEHDGSENMVKVTDALGGEYKTEFSAMNERLRQIDPLGRITELSYNPNYTVSMVASAQGTAVEAFTKIKYNGVKQQVQIIDPEGRSGDFQLDPLYRVTEVLADKDGENANVVMKYDAVGNIIISTDAEGNSTNFRYDAIDRVTEVIDALGNSIKYEYDSNGNTVRSTDAKGNITNYGYDRINRLVLSKDALDGEVNLSYDSNGNVVATTNQNNVVTAFNYDGLDRLTKTIESHINPAQLSLIQTNGLAGLLPENTYDLTTEYGYDHNSNLTSTTNPRGYSTAFEYDALNRRTKVIDAKSNFSTSEYDAVGNLKIQIDRNGNKTKFSHDELNRITRTIDAEGNVVRFGYDKVGNVVKNTDAKGNITRYTYNGLDQLTKITDALNGITKYNQDKVGNILELVDANGHSSNFEYDNIYNLTKSLNAEGHSNLSSYDANRNQVRVTDANSNNASSRYDALNRLVEVTDALNGSTGFTFDAVGNLLNLNDANSHIDNYKYDPINRQTVVIDAEGNKSDIEYDANGNVIVVTDANGNSTLFEYDELDRLISQTNAEGETVGFEYDNEGNKVTKVDPDGVRTAYSYDDIYRLTDVNLNSSEGGIDSQNNVNTAYLYDPNSNLTKIIDPRGNLTKFGYDALDRQIEETNAKGNIWIAGYDAVGNKTSRVDGKGNATSYSYLPDNQLGNISYFDGTAVSFGYDPNNNRVAMNDSLGSSSWSYDALNRLTNEVDSLNRTKVYGYDAVGNTTALTYPDGRVVNYKYLNNDWLAGVTDPEGLVTNYKRDNVGNVTKVVNPNNTVSDLEYDNVYRETGIVNYEVGGKVNSSFNYSYDLVGQSTSIRKHYGWRQPDAVTETYEYDPIRRLTASTTSEGIYSNYSYDRASNRVNWVSNNDETTPRPFDKTDLIYSYDKINSLIRVRENSDTMPETPGNKPVREIVPGQVKKDEPKTRTVTKTEHRPIPKHSQKFIDTFKNFVNQLEAQDQKQISESAYEDLTNQVENLQKLAKDGLLIQSKATQLVRNLEESITDFADTGDIKSSGISNALIKKLKDVKTAISNLPLELEDEVIITTEEVPAQVAGVNDDNVSTPLNPEPDPFKKIEFRYDSNGNRVRMEQYGPVGPEYQLTRYNYDPENRLNTVTNFDSAKGSKWTIRDISDMDYDGIGRRLVKTYDPKSDSKVQEVGAGRKRVEYVFDGLDAISEYNINNGQYQNFYRTRRAGGFSGQSRMISTQTLTPDGSKPKYYFHHDALGSIVGMTKHEGQGHKNYRYEDFGLLEGQTGQRSTHSTKDSTDPQNHYTYTGQEWDEHTGVYEYYSRAYDPINGVWLRQDDYRGDISNPQSLNRYMFVNQNGVNGWDVDGFDEYSADGTGLIYLTDGDYSNYIFGGGAGILQSGGGLPSLSSLATGTQTNYVYYGLNEAGERIYVGITNNVVVREVSHGSRFAEGLSQINSNPIYRNEARAIEQSLINKNPNFTNKINSISKNNSIYDDALVYGDDFLKAGGGSSKAVKAIKVGGKVVIVAAVLMDGYEVLNSDNMTRTGTAKVSAWGAAWAGAKVGCLGLGAGGAAIGTVTVPIVGTVGLAGVGCFIGGIGGGVGGYFGGEWLGTQVYDHLAGGTSQYYDVCNETSTLNYTSAGSMTLGDNVFLWNGSDIVPSPSASSLITMPGTIPIN